MYETLDDGCKYCLVEHHDFNAKLHTIQMTWYSLLAEQYLNPHE